MTSKCIMTFDYDKRRWIWTAALREAARARAVVAQPGDQFLEIQNSVKITKHNAFRP